jgi:hypothetical protein
MSIATVRGVLLWGAVINYALLASWGLLTLLARDRIRRKAPWFGVPAETFDAINYAGILFYKVSIFLFYLVPYIALRIVAG